MDALTGTYALPCPHGGRLRATVVVPGPGALPGASHPAVYAIQFECGCGEEHVALLPHDELDWAPLGLGNDLAFVNLMTGQAEAVAAELADRALRRLAAGEWPWSFFCYLEERPRPITPSAFSVIAPGGEALGIAVRCPSCSSTSVNVVSREHGLPSGTTSRWESCGTSSSTTRFAPSSSSVPSRLGRLRPDAARARAMSRSQTVHDPFTPGGDDLMTQNPMKKNVETAMTTPSPARWMRPTCCSATASPWARCRSRGSLLRFDSKRRSARLATRLLSALTPHPRAS